MSKNDFGSRVFIVFEAHPDPTEARRYLGVHTFIRAPKGAALLDPCPTGQAPLPLEPCPGVSSLARANSPRELKKLRSGPSAHLL